MYYNRVKNDVTMKFQMISKENILFQDVNENKEEIIDFETYKLFENDQIKSGRTDIELIPIEYLTFLKTTKGMDEITFNQLIWDKDISIKLSPKLNECIFNFQREAVYRMIMKKRCLNASSMGIGKSLQGLAALSFFKSEKKGDLIICPGYY